LEFQSDSRRSPRRIIMVGTAFETRGGISAVVNAYRAGGLFGRWPIEYVPTHGDGNALFKLWFALRGMVLLLLLLARPGRAIMHVHIASRASFWRKALFMAVGLLAGCALVFHLHGGGFAQFYESRGRLARALIRGFLGRSHTVIVLSERWRDWVTSVVQHPHVVCIPNPITHPVEKLDQLEVRRAGGNTVLYLGRLDRNKGIYDLLRVIASLRSAIPDVQLVCAGDGELEEVRRCAAELGIEDSVNLTGWIGTEDKARWLKRADVFVLPSYAEGLPMSVLEAMAAGMPVLASAVGGIPDVITDGVNGFLSAPGDRAMVERLLRRLLLDAPLRARVGAAARETARLRFSSDKVLAQVDALYSGLGVERRQPPRPAMRINAPKEAA
jgi:glycosyltransferase involved in cell wall biosynthesis